MITKEGLNEINNELASVDVKGKAYVMVNKRVKAFRELCPDGCIETDIISLENGIVTMKAIVKDETGKIISSGMAQEKETSSYINKTSYIENCETSAVGRALGFVGIGVDGSMASSEEVMNAKLQQKMLESPITLSHYRMIEKDIEDGLFTEENLLKWFKAERFEDLTEEQFAQYAVKKAKA